MGEERLFLFHTHTEVTVTSSEFIKNSGGDTGIRDAALQDEVNIVLSDLHLSEGKTLIRTETLPFARRMWRWIRSLIGPVEPLREIEEKNPLEDFPHDEIFDAFVHKISERYAGMPVLRLRLMGDAFDPLAVTWKGKFIDHPFEYVAEDKIRRIIEGHRVFFDALVRFLHLPNTQLDLFVGNHDQFLVWPAVQDMIRNRLCGEDPSLLAKLRFVDQDMNFTDVHRRVLYYHGMNAEPSNTINAEDCILYTRFGVKLDRPVLNMPLGSYMTIRVVNKIKMKNPLVGRLHNVASVWVNAALHRWGWNVYAGAALFWTFVHSQLLAFWNIRRKSKFWLTVKIVFATIVDDSVGRYANKMLKDRDDVDVVVMGHDHRWRRQSGAAGTYINTGSWALMFDLVEPEFPRLWKRFRRIEKLWRGLLHFLQTGEIRFAAQLTKLIGFITLVAAMSTFLAVSFPAEEGWMIWGMHISGFKIPMGILLVFVLLSGVIRIFAVKPKVVTSLKLTFARIKHTEDKGLQADLMEYLPEEGQIRACV